MVAETIALTIPAPIWMPRRGSSQVPMKAPMTPMMRSPISPKPVPLTSCPASQPATTPTSKMTRRPSLETLMLSSLSWNRVLPNRAPIRARTSRRNAGGPRCGLSEQPRLGFGGGGLHGHEDSALGGDLLHQVLEGQHAVAATDDVGVHGVGEHTPVRALLHVKEFVEPVLHY